MAWWSLYKWFIQFKKTSYVNYISWYKRHLYNEWFNNLSTEEQDEEQKRIQKAKEKRERETQRALENLGLMYQMMDRLSGGRMDEITQVARMVNKVTYHPSKYW